MRNHIKVMLHVNWMRIFRLNNNFLRLRFDRSLHFYCLCECMWVSMLVVPHTECAARVGNGSCGNSLLRESNKRELDGCSVHFGKKERKNEKCVCIIFISMDGILWTLIFPYCVDIKCELTISNGKGNSSGSTTLIILTIESTFTTCTQHTQKWRKNIVYLTPRFKYDDIAINSIIVHIEIQKWN